MKKLNEIGRILTRQEMKSVNGGFRQCGLDDGFVCGPPCPPPSENHGEQSTGWACESPRGACKPELCEIS